MKSYAAAYLLPDEELNGSLPRARVGRVTTQPLGSESAPHLQDRARTSPGAPAFICDARRPWAAGARELVKLHLKRLGTATVAELAASIGTLSAGAIGPRLTELDQLGQARWWRVKPRGPGQPKKVWTLTQ